MKNMQIRLMDPADYPAISQIDLAAFKRDSIRSVENVAILNSFEPEGCFVALYDHHIVGFIFTRILGKIGYFGPVAVLPEEQTKGLGKLLIGSALGYLKPRCNLIGIEVRPESGRNIGLYYRMGFSTFLPTLVFELPKKVTFNLDHNSAVEISDFSSAEKENMLNEIASWTKKIEPDLDFTKDLKLVIDQKGFMAVSKDKEGRINGFLAYAPSLMTYIWGAVKEDQNQINNLRSLIYLANNKIQAKPLYLAINTRYNKVVEELVAMNCRFLRAYNRMFWQKDNTKSDLTFVNDKNAVFRALMG